MTSLTTKKKPGEYDREDIERVLAFLFNGGIPWKPETAAESDMPRAATNPAHGNSVAAELVDVKRAWWGIYDSLHSREALWYHYGCGMTAEEISKAMSIPRRIIGDALVHDVGLLRDAATQGVRP